MAKDTTTTQNVVALCAEQQHDKINLFENGQDPGNGQTNGHALHTNNLVTNDDDSPQMKEIFRPLQGFL